MQLKGIINFVVACMLLCLFLCFAPTAIAQKIQYSSENVLVDYPDYLHLVANIGGNHHLISMINNEKPVINIFDRDLLLKTRITIPFKFPEKSEIKIISFDRYYYIYIHQLDGSKLYFWKIDADGNFTDFSDSFQKLIHSQIHTRVRYQMFANHNELCLISHTYLPELEKYQTIIVRTDSLLKVSFTQKVLYDLNAEDENVVQETLLSGNLLVLKASRRGTTLELMKINLGTAYSITYTFRSTGYLYWQSGFNYSEIDSCITVYSLLREPRNLSKIQRSVFISKMDTSLIERQPFTILKSQFLKNTYANFLLVDGGSSKWICFRTEREHPSYISYETFASDIPVSKDYTSNDPRYLSQSSSGIPGTGQMFDIRGSIYTPLPATPQYNQRRVEHYMDDPSEAIRFSLLNREFKITSDSLVPNNKNSYSLQADQFALFASKNKNYILLSQRFFKRKNGLLMVNADDANKLKYTDVIVNVWNDYLLSSSEVIPGKGIIMPYMHKREAGLIKITMD